MTMTRRSLIKRQKILNGQSKMANAKKLATHDTQDEDKQNKNIFNSLTDHCLTFIQQYFSSIQEANTLNNI